MIAVNEFITRLEQGYTEAFLCRGEDGHLYVTKSWRSGRESLIREWVCGRIARRLGLPVPPIELLHASRTTADYSGNEHLAALAAEPGFGSRFVGSAATLNVADVPIVPQDLRRAVLLFDWWILNFDRTDDNPNLLWEPVGAGLHVIDHNLAFDDDPPAEFWSHHIFRADRTVLPDPVRQAHDSAAMNAILKELPGIWSELPESWVEGCSLTLNRVDAVLRRSLSSDFWFAG